MIWLDRDIGACHQCGTERRLFERDSCGVLLCSVCTLEKEKARSSLLLRSLPDTQLGVVSVTKGFGLAGTRARARRQDRGLCWDCDERATRGLRCDYHADLVNRNAKRVQEARRSRGLCIRCPNKVNGTSLCDQCNEKGRNRRISRKRYVANE